MCGQYPRSRAADRWAAEEAREREAQLVAVADAQVRAAEVRARIAQREADEREERARAERSERRRAQMNAQIARVIR
jgi:hypothetical protein